MKTRTPLLRITMILGALHALLGWLLLPALPVGLAGWLLGGAVLLADPTAMYEFSVEIQQLVPLGAEDEFYCLDEALEEIFRVELPRSTQS